jgi:hypothetical protein
MAEGMPPLVSTRVMPIALSCCREADKSLHLHDKYVRIGGVFVFGERRSITM